MSTPDASIPPPHHFLSATVQLHLSSFGAGLIGGYTVLRADSLRSVPSFRLLHCVYVFLAFMVSCILLPATETRPTMLMATNALLGSFVSLAFANLSATKPPPTPIPATPTSEVLTEAFAATDAADAAHAERIQDLFGAFLDEASGAEPPSKSEDGGRGFDRERGERAVEVKRGGQQELLQLVEFLRGLLRHSSDPSSPDVLAFADVPKRKDAPPAQQLLDLLSSHKRGASGRQETLSAAASGVRPEPSFQREGKNSTDGAAFESFLAQHLLPAVASQTIPDTDDSSRRAIDARQDDPEFLFPLTSYVALVASFHFFEFLFTAVFHAREVKFDSFVLNPVPYGIYNLMQLLFFAEYWARGLRSADPEGQGGGSGAEWWNTVGDVGCRLLRGPGDLANAGLLGTFRLGADLLGTIPLLRLAEALGVVPPSSPAVVLSLNHILPLRSLLLARVSDNLAARFDFTFLGLFVALFGLGLRVLALFTAGQNFTHLVAHRRASHHQLVQSGVYSLCRHPGYVGWSLWVLGIQLLLRNFYTGILSVAAIFCFFVPRIRHEEMTLVVFFGDDYLQYAKRVGAGLPFCSELTGDAARDAEWASEKLLLGGKED